MIHCGWYWWQQHRRRTRSNRQKVYNVDRIFLGQERRAARSIITHYALHIYTHMWPSHNKAHGEVIEMNSNHQHRMEEVSDITSCWPSAHVAQEQQHVLYKNGCHSLSPVHRSRYNFIEKPGEWSNLVACLRTCCAVWIHVLSRQLCDRASIWCCAVYIQRARDFYGSYKAIVMQQFVALVLFSHSQTRMPPSRRCGQRTRRWA